MIAVLSKVLPLLLLILGGVILKRTEYIQPSSLADIKKLVINVSLPAILFRTFVYMELGADQFYITVAVIVMLFLFYGGGWLVHKLFIKDDPFLPYTTTAFSFGLLSIPLFATVFGAENLSVISILGMGHELFIWIAFYNMMKMRFGGESVGLRDVLAIFRSPLVLSVLLGIVFNIIGFASWVEAYPLLGAIDQSLVYLAGLATPLILFIIGFTLKINPDHLGKSLQYLAIRYVIILVIGYAMKFLVIDLIAPPSDLFNHAYYTFLITSPPFSLPIFAEQYAGRVQAEVTNNLVVLSIFMSLILYIPYLLIMVG